ncbi:MAG: diaminopimelate decarboxylase [Alphaproteobacteria bacterium]|nr:diaminopimelate decarboxylase [Alphaproteobacteria bacterium]MCL2504840.1 diaminopimelate decarboxylase [Alphaproteobacteria bacterium]
MEEMWLTDEEIFELTEQFGTPLYVYDEKTLRKRCQELHNLLPNKNFRVSYSAKANSNVEFLKIVKDEDIDVDAMSPGEIYTQQLAGFPKERIFFIPNNVSSEEMKYAIDRGILVSVDSLSQMKMYGQLNPGGKVAVRCNPSTGTGHHEKVVTAGKKTKFGIQTKYVDDVKKIAAEYKLNIVGINQHLGSLFLTPEPYVAGAKELLDIAKQFPGLKFIDFGGGFGMPYKENEGRLDLKKLSAELDKLFTEFLADYDNKNVIFQAEPGRYIAAECGILLGTVHTIKDNYDTEYVGTDLGFNVLKRPVMYDSYHSIHVAKKDTKAKDNTKHTYNIVGNICESGDIIAKQRELPHIDENDIIAVRDAGAYGFAMSSNYNCRLRPAEVLKELSGAFRLIRRRETFEDLVECYVLDTEQKNKKRA